MSEVLSEGRQKIVKYFWKEFYLFCDLAQRQPRDMQCGCITSPTHTIYIEQKKTLIVFENL